MISRDTLTWVREKVQNSTDPAMRDVVPVLQAMVERGRRGAPRADERNLQIACLLHAEILEMRSAGVREYDIRGRAAHIVRASLESANPGKRVPTQKRLLEVYRANEASVQRIWPEIEAFLLNQTSTQKRPRNS